MEDYDADLLIKLGKLLKKKRDPDIQKRVDKIAASEISNKEKIHHIEKLDKIALQSGQKKSSKKSKTKKNKSNDLIDKGKRAINKLKKPVKELTGRAKKILPSSFFHFLFKERNKIKHFGIATKTLSPRFFALKFSFTKDVRKLLTQKIWDEIYIIMRPLKYTLREGWKKLSKFQYNTAVYFLAFCEEFYKFDFRNINIENINTRKSMVEIQQLYFTVIQDRTHREHLLHAIETMTKDHEIYKKQADKAVQSTRHIIDPGFLRPSLANTFLSAYMVEYKKYIKYEDFLDILSVKPISGDKFDCSEKIKSKIKNFIDDLLSRLAKLEKELFLVNLLKNEYLQGIQDNQVNYIILKKFFSLRTENLRAKKDISFEDYHQDMVGFMYRLISNFFYVFDPLFTDTVPINENGEIKKVKVLPHNIIANVVHYVKLYTERLNRFILRHLNTKIYFEDYKEYLNTGKTPYENEHEFFDLIKDSTTALFELGKNIAYLTHYSDKTSLASNLQNTVAYADKTIHNIPGFEDLSVNDYLNTLANFCFKYSHFFKNTKQNVLIDSEMRTRSEINGIRETLKRIG